MGTLLLRLAAPLQSWGTDSKFDIRKTDRYPSKSGVMGMLAAALGYSRDADMRALNALRFGVRMDQEGTLLRDYHTVRKDAKTSYVTNRYYLSDAVFLVGVESNDIAFLKQLEQAVQAPVFPLFLGRRSCPPTLPLCLGIRDCGLEQALRNEDWLCASWRQHKENPHLTIIMDCQQGESGASQKRDVALSFDPAHRQYGFRLIKQYRSVDKTVIPDKTSHDPMAEL